MATATIGTARGIIRDYWNERGIPKASYKKASPLFTMLFKGRDDRWNGGDTTGNGEPIMNMGQRVGLPGAGSSNFTQAFNNPTNTKNTRWLITPSEFWQHMSLAWKGLAFGSGDRAYIKLKIMESAGHVERWTNVMSCYLWGNGGGAIARGGGAGAVINGVNTFTLRNINNAMRFEEGDRLQWSATDGTTGTVRTVAKTILNVNEATGVITLDSNLVTADGVLDNDFVFFAGTFGTVPVGLFGWCPLTSALASTTLFGVARNGNISLAGNRLQRTSGLDPWQTIAEMLTEAEIKSQMLDVIMVSPIVYQKLQSSARPQTLVLVNGSGGTGASPGYSSPIVDNPKHLRYGVPGLCIWWAAMNKPVWIYGDRYLSDITVARENDYILFGMTLEEFFLATSNKGVAWAQYDDAGPSYQVLGQQSTSSFYGDFMQFACENPRNLTIVSPSVA